LSRIDPSTLSQDDVKKLKKLRRAIRNRESATASRLRRKEYIEDLEKRMSELSSQNTLLNISVTEMQMREKDKREEEERIRLENERLRADTEATRIANQKLREEKLYMQQVSEKLQAFKFSHPSAPSSGGKDDELVEPPTWPPPRQKTPVLVFRQ
jgi:TolA-binding protein